MSNKMREKENNTLPCAGTYNITYREDGRGVLVTCGQHTAWICGVVVVAWRQGRCCRVNESLLLGTSRRVLLLTRGLCLHRWLSIHTVQLPICTSYNGAGEKTFTLAISINGTWNFQTVKLYWRLQWKTNFPTCSIGLIENMTDHLTRIMINTINSTTNILYPS